MGHGTNRRLATVASDAPGMNALPPGSETEGDVGSIIIVIATDAPLLPHQLKRLARRASLGLARTGSTSGNGSGDIFLAFSTGNAHVDASPGPNTVKTVSNERISPLFTGYRGGDRRSDCECHGRREDNDRHRRAHRDCPAPRSAAADAEEVQPVSAFGILLILLVGFREERDVERQLSVGRLLFLLAFGPSSRSMVRCEFTQIHPPRIFS